MIDTSLFAATFPEREEVTVKVKSEFSNISPLITPKSL
jgi:hypothetical protein